MNPKHFYADPNLTFYFDDPHLTFYFVSDLTFCFDPDRSVQFLGGCIFQPKFAEF